MKKFVAIIITIILAVAMTACDASGGIDTSTGTGRGQIGPIEDYHIDKNAWMENDIITTSKGHAWLVPNPTNYTGRMEVSYDGRGTADVGDDILVIALPPEN